MESSIFLVRWRKERVASATITIVRKDEINNEINDMDIKSSCYQTYKPHVENSHATEIQSDTASKYLREGQVPPRLIIYS